MTFEEWEKVPAQIPLWEFLKAIHRWTEKVTIHVIVGSEWLEEDKKIRDFYLTRNAFKRTEDNRYAELERLLKYYSDVPVWNATARFENVYLSHLNLDTGGCVLASCINVNCHYRDMRDAWNREQNDIRREKRRERERKKREQQRGNRP